MRLQEIKQTQQHPSESSEQVYYDLTIERNH